MGGRIGAAGALASRAAPLSDAGSASGGGALEPIDLVGVVAVDSRVNRLAGHPQPGRDLYEAAALAQDFALRLVALFRPR